jgi:PAS domain S-box-containing protein
MGNGALARVYGTTVDDLVGKTDADFNPDAGQVAAFRRDDRQVMTTRREVLLPEEPVRTATGEERWFSTVKVPLVNDDGTCDQVLGVATDITERKRAEEALRSADRQKDQFLAMLAHELRNPLAAIASAAQVIRTRLAQGERAERPLEVLERQIRNSARLLDDLLDVSRITRGALHLSKAEVRLDEIVTSAVEAQRPLVETAGHQLTVSLPEEPVLVDADPTRLEQVISNLLNNAAKYTPERGRIAVRVERRDGDALIRVTDDGVGIAPDLLPRIFDTFVQAEQPLARTKGGLGLGLALVRRLVEMHAGSVEARSDGVGKGTEFVVRLPARGSSRAAAPAPTSPAPSADGTPSRRVLLVEDNFDAAELMSEYLDSLGHDVSVAHDGPAALETAARVRPQVVLLDIGLPGMDGYEVARRLRASGLSPSPVIIAITGYGQDDDRKRSCDAGFAHHLTKPFEPRILERLLAEVPVEPGSKTRGANTRAG